jgi:putative PEP-CTERM system TPR-repeat lipoprotein
MGHTVKLRLALWAVMGVLLAGCSREDPNVLLASAREYLAKDEPRSAVIQLKNVLQRDPNSAEARWLLGKALFDNGDPALAAVELSKAAELKYAPDAVIPVLAKAWLSQGEHEKLIAQHADTTLSSADARADLKTSLASAFSVQGRRPQAEAAISAALEAVPGHAGALTTRARMLASASDFDGALRQVDQVLTKAPDDHDALLLKAGLLAQRDADPKEIAAVYKQAVAARPRSLPAHVGVITAYLGASDVAAAKTHLEALKKLHPGHPLASYFDAQLAAQRKDFKAANEIVQVLMKGSPDDPRVLHLAGVVAYGLGSFVQAEQHLTGVLKVVPGHIPARRLLVDSYLRSGQPDKAINAAAPLLEQGGADPAALAMVATAYLQSGNALRAEEMFVRAVRQDPDSDRKKIGLALSQLAGGKTKAALADLESIAATSADATADLALISALMRRNDGAGVLRAVDRLERKQPDKPLPYFLRGMMLVRSDPAAARRSFEKAVSVDRVFVSAIEGLAALDAREGKLDTAQQRFEQLLQEQPGHARGMIALAELRMRAGRPKEEVRLLLAQSVQAAPQDPLPRQRLAEHYLRQKDHRAALQTAQDAVAALPDQPPLIGVLAAAQFAAGDHQQAISSFNRLAGLLPKSPRPQIGLAEVQLAMKNLPAAEQSLKRALALAPDNLLAQSRLVSVSLAQGRPNEALDVARKMQKQRPGGAEGFLAEGDVEAYRKSWSPAVAAYRAAMRKQPSGRAAEKLHAALRASGQDKEADALATDWLKEHANDAAFVFYLASVALVSGDNARAEERLQQVLKIQPDHAMALNNLAWVLHEQRKPGALQLAERANQLLPNQPALLDTLAACLAAEKQLGRAIDVQKQAVSLLPGSHTLRLALAKLYIEAGDKALARTELQPLLALGNGVAAREKARELMGQL